MLPTPLGFVNNCQYFLISRSDLEGAYRKAFLVCKSGRYCHPRWMGSGDGLRDVGEKWGAVKFVSPMPNTRTRTHTLLSAFFHLSLPGATPLVSKFPPNKMVSSLYQFFCVVFPLSLISRLLCQALLKDFLIGGLCSYLIIWEVYSSAAAESFLFFSKFLFLHYRPAAIYNITLIHTVIQ